MAVILALLVAVAVGAYGAAGAGAKTAGPTKLTVWVGWSAGTELISFTSHATALQSRCTRSNLVRNLAETAP